MSYKWKEQQYTKAILLYSLYKTYLRQFKILEDKRLDRWVTNNFFDYSKEVFSDNRTVIKTRRQIQEEVGEKIVTKEDEESLVFCFKIFIR